MWWKRDLSGPVVPRGVTSEDAYLSWFELDETQVLKHTLWYLIGTLWSATLGCAILVNGCRSSQRAARAPAQIGHPTSKNPTNAGNPVSTALRPATVERWGIFEIGLAGPSVGNPFIEVVLSAHFSQGERIIEVPAFYDGQGMYRVRFMPDTIGLWHYHTESNRPELDKRYGVLEVSPAGQANHGPVQVAHTFHFAYADGTPYRPVGTTAYSWNHRPAEVEEQTLKALASSPFNKLRMCVFPQTYGTDIMPPTYFPFAGEPTDPDYTRFNPEFFRHLEERVAQLSKLGIEADLILFHPYDDDNKWKLNAMPRDVEERYLRYLIARLGAYRNIWWSMANEFNLIQSKTDADWDEIFQIVADADVHSHLRSIHNGKEFYDHNKPWVTHVSIQNGFAVTNPGAAQIYRDVYEKPIVFDEVEYEGNHPRRWAQLSGQEMVHRFWAGTVVGTYVGHSEFFLQPDDATKLAWVATGGSLKGESPPRLAFLRKILDDSPTRGIEPIDKWWHPNVGGQPGEYYLIYLGRESLGSWPFHLYHTGISDGDVFEVDVIDTWDMKITPVSHQFVAKRKDHYSFGDSGNRVVKLPNKPGIVLRVRRVAQAQQARDL